METNNYLSKGYVQFLLTLILIGVVLALGAYIKLTLNQAEGVYTGDTTITVAGEGEVFAKPDLGQFSFSVMAEAETAEAAQEQSAESINEIMSYLEEAGVEEKDIKTTGYNVYPRYEWETATDCVFAGDCDRERVLKGYETTQTVFVKVRETDKAGELISGVGSRGATNISGLNFTIDDETALQAEAREKAIADAKEKAEKLADDLGMRIVRIVGFNEGGNYPVMYAAKGLGGDMAMDMEESAANIAPSLPMGENTITSNVTISYEIR